MTDIVEWLRKEAELVAPDRLNEAATEIERLLADLKQAESNGIEFEQQRDKALAEIERLRADRDSLGAAIEGARMDWAKAVDEVERLRAALQALHDWYVEYARINNLFNGDGTPATFHELLEARRALEPKP